MSSITIYLGTVLISRFKIIFLGFVIGIVISKNFKTQRAVGKGSI